MTYQISTVILAGGEGKRLKVATSKPMAKASGQCLVDYPIQESLRFFEDENLEGCVNIVVGHRREELKSYLDSQGYSLGYAVQAEQLGTAHALQCYFEQTENSWDSTYTVVMCADTPLIRSVDLDRLYKEISNKNLDAVVASFHAGNPTGYGRIVHAVDGGFSIVEEKDATPEERSIQEVNSGLYVFKTELLKKFLHTIGSENQSNEYYLTDIFKASKKVESIQFEEEWKFLGVNDLAQLEEVTRYLQEEKRTLLRNEGVQMIDSSTNYIDWMVSVGAGTILYPQVHLRGKTKVGEQCLIEVGSILMDSELEEGVQILPYSILEDATVLSKAAVGPFARLRPKASVGEECKVGNFVEIKKAKLEKGSKVSHLSYVGDAEIGENTNLGCGFISCNYDGANKHLTKIGKDCFIGSDSQMVAPVEIGDECFVASGSTITDNMPAGSFAISRNKQTTKEGMARRFIKKK